MGVTSTCSNTLYAPSSSYRVNCNDRRNLTIGALAKRTDTKVETIRCYQRIDLLPAPARTRGNYRAYGSEHLGRLSFIRHPRDLEFPIENVRELLSLVARFSQSEWVCVWVTPRLPRSRGSPTRVLAVIFKLAEAAEKSWRRLNGHNQLPKVVFGVKFADGIEVRPEAQAVAA
jgi:DNA-binding transcriptional MerR regulator